MLKEELQKKIENKIEALEESVKYNIESLCELLSGIETISYLL